MKILLVCSSGGHLTQMQALAPAFAGHELRWVTYEGGRTGSMDAYLLPYIGLRPHRYITGLVRAWRILKAERPDLLVSTGSEIAIPFLLLARRFGTHTIYVESVTRVRTPSGTVRVACRRADDVYVQWPELQRRLGPKARYEGGLL
jgi:UDP-N-acetylglucosamine:LPS N-acetylglucosamine transferase